MNVVSEDLGYRRAFAAQGNKCAASGYVESACPVEGFGHVTCRDGFRTCWFFRAEADGWSLCVGPTSELSDEFVSWEDAIWTAVGGWRESDDEAACGGDYSVAEMLVVITLARFIESRESA